jgi:hypothetical protein
VLEFKKYKMSYLQSINNELFVKIKKMMELQRMVQSCYLEVDHLEADGLSFVLRIVFEEHAIGKNRTCSQLMQTSKDATYLLDQ